MVSVEAILIGLLQALAALALAPLFSGFSRVLRAKMHNRRGPHILQNYHDLAKLMKRQEVVSSQAGWIFRATPYVLIAAMLLAAAIIPMATVQSPFGWAADLILAVYLFALPRFFFAMSGLDAGNPFAGLGSKRELSLSSLTEPIMLLVLFVMALLAGSTQLGVISAGVAGGQIRFYTSVWLGMIAFAFVTFVEMGKVPFDMAEAEQELQEGPLAEYSGSGLALMKWGLYLKQVVVVALFLAVFLPFGSAPEITGWRALPQVGLGALIFLLKAGLFYAIAGLLENAVARVRFLKTSVTTWTAFGAAVLSFVFYLANV